MNWRRWEKELPNRVPHASLSASGDGSAIPCNGRNRVLGSHGKVLPFGDQSPKQSEQLVFPAPGATRSWTPSAGQKNSHFARNSFRAKVSHRFPKLTADNPAVSFRNQQSMPGDRCYVAGPRTQGGLSRQLPRVRQENFRNLLVARGCGEANSAPRCESRRVGSLERIHAIVIGTCCRPAACYLALSNLASFGNLTTPLGVRTRRTGTPPPPPPNWTITSSSSSTCAVSGFLPW